MGKYKQEGKEEEKRKRVADALHHQVLQTTDGAFVTKVATPSGGHGFSGSEERWLHRDLHHLPCLTGNLEARIFKNYRINGEKEND